MIRMDEVAVPAGYGLRVLSRAERQQLSSYENHLVVWEAPRKEHVYVVAVDVSDGIGLDRSVVDVGRVGTVEEPDEQVAQFVSRTTDPIDLAKIVDAIGHLYADEDGMEALAAVETNNHGIATQSELERHLGYGNFFIWQVEDAAPGTNRYTRRVGWYTSSRTRPLIISRLVKSVKTVDPISGKADFIINSPFTLAEMADFCVPPGGQIGDASASGGHATDDCLMTAAILVHVAQTLHFEQREPLSETRRRHSFERIRADRESARAGAHRDFINTDATVEEVSGNVDYDGWTGAWD